MTFKIEDREFSIIKASDVSRDGIYVELNEIIQGEEKWLFEIFYNEETKEKECRFFEADIPLEALLKLIETGKEWSVAQ